MDLIVWTDKIRCSTDILDEYLNSGCRYLIFHGAAHINSNSYVGNVNYVLRRYEVGDDCVPRYLTVTNIRQNISRKHGPKFPQKIFGTLIEEAIESYPKEFEAGDFIPLERYICVHGQSSMDRDLFGWYPYTALTVIRIQRS